MSRAAGRNRTRPGGTDPESPEGREMGVSARQDPAGSPIPGLTGNITNYETHRQAVASPEPMDQFRGMMAHGVPHEEDTTAERAVAMRGGPNVARTRAVPSARPRELPPPVPVYIVEPGDAPGAIRTASPRHITIANNASDAVRLCGRSAKRNRIGLLNEDGTTDVRFAVSPRDLNGGGGAFLPHSQTSYLWLETQDELYALTTSATLTVSVSVIEETGQELVTAGFYPPAHWGETTSQLRKSGSVTLDANGKGSLSFSPDSANQRWVVTTVIVTTNQSATATLVPYATGALNTTDISAMSPGNQLGTSYDGNNDTFGGPPFDVGPCDFYSVLFYPPPGQSGSPLSGVIATAVVQGTKYTRRT